MQASPNMLCMDVCVPYWSVVKYIPLTNAYLLLSVGMSDVT